MQRICFFNTYPNWGGGVKFYIEHAIGLKDMGYDVSAVCRPESVLSKAYSEHGIRQLNMTVTGRSLLNPMKVAKLIRYYQKEKIDIVVFTTSEDLKLGSVTAKIAGVKTIIYRRGLAVPIRDRISNRYIFSKVLTHIMANSEETKRTILKHLEKHIDADKIKVIYNGLDTSQKKDQVPMPLITEKGKGIIIGNAGRLVEQKGQKYLVDIGKKLRQEGVEFTIYIAGSGPLEEDLKKSIAAAGLEDQIILLGYLESMDNFMASIDVFALTSLWEGFGYVIAEAMLATKPVVAFNTSSTPELVTNGQNGYLIDYPDTSSFVEKLSILANDEAKRNQMGTNGANSAKDRFEIKKQIIKFAEFINSEI